MENSYYNNIRGRKKMELGNMIFGNSRGEFLLERGVGFEDCFYNLVNLISKSGEVVEFLNDVFEIFPYYW